MSDWISFHHQNCQHLQKGTGNVHSVHADSYCTSEMIISHPTTSQRCSSGLRPGDRGGRRVKSSSCLLRNQCAIISALWCDMVFLLEAGVNGWLHCDGHGQQEHSGNNAQWLLTCAITATAPQAWIPDARQDGSMWFMANSDTDIWMLQEKWRLQSSVV